MFYIVPLHEIYGYFLHSCKWPSHRGVTGLTAVYVHLNLFTRFARNRKHTCGADKTLFYTAGLTCLWETTSINVPSLGGIKEEFILKRSLSAL